MVNTMTERYTRNMPAITADEQTVLKNKKVLVVGCGGLGGYAIEYLARIGVGCIVAVDGDVFCESNLNRQLYSTMQNLGISKSAEAAARVAAINPEIEVQAVNEFFSRDNAATLLKGIDVVIDALDNVEARLMLEDACEDAGIPMVHGAVQGWNLQATVVQPGSKTLHDLYKSGAHNASEQDPDTKTCLCPTPACCASIQIAEALKLLLGRESSLSGRMLFMDLQTAESYLI